MATEPAAALKEFPEFPGEPMSKRCVGATSSARAADGRRMRDGDGTTTR
jgi:hypothetical protein